MSNYKDLIVWQKSIQLVIDIYKLTEVFPKDECYGLVSQMQRAVVSIPSNIAEGNERSSNKEFAHFLYIAKGSLAELETILASYKVLHNKTDVDSAQRAIRAIEIEEYYKNEAPEVNEYT